MAYHIDVNTIRVRTVILDVFPDIYKHMIENWFPPATVERMIKTDNDKFLKQISPAEKKIIQSLKVSQYRKVDGALMYKIIRYFKLIQEPTKGWGKVPEAYHINQGDDAERMRKLRNDYVHDNSSTVSDEKFHDFFNESIEIAGRLDLTVGRLVNGLKEQVINIKTSVIGNSVVEREKKNSTEKKFFTIDSESGGKSTGVKLYYGNEISYQFTCHENEEFGSDEYTLILLIDGKAECQKIVDYVKKYPEACSSPAIQIKYAEQGSIILHISIDRKSFTSCEILHDAIQLFIKTIFHHEEIQRTNMLDFDMVLAIADYTEQDSHDRGTICSDNSYLAEDMSDPWNNQGVKLYLTIPKKTFAERTDFYLHMDSVIRAVMSATTIDISIDKPIHAILMKCDRKEVSMNALYLSCCQNCNSDISQSQRFCDNCGHRNNHSIDKGSLCTGKIDGSPCYNVINSRIKFCGSCGTKNDKYIPDTTIRNTTIISDNSLHSEHDADTEDKWEPHDIDSDIADDSSRKSGVTLNTSLNSANDVNQEDKWEPQTIEKGSFSNKKDIQTDENVLSEHDGKQDHGDTDIHIENVFRFPGPSSKMGIQTDENVLSEHDGIQEPGDTETCIENGPSSKKDIQTDKNVPSEHDGKQEPGDTKTCIEKEATISNQAQATKVDPKDIKKMLEEKLQKEGLKKTHEYIESVLNSHRQNPVRLAVSGRFHAGKSTFINTMLGSKKGDKSYAKSGHGNTTTEVTKYPHPENDMIIFYDLPGFGSLSMTRQKFLEKVNISDFDYFFIMFDSVLSEDDAWFVGQIKSTMAPFCLVRTKLDLTLSKDEEVEDTVIQNIRQSHLKSLENHPDLQKTPLFIISSDQPHIGEMTLLIEYIKNSTSDDKCAAIMHFIPMITESVIQIKYEQLCKRIPWAAFQASVISALPIPFLDILLNVVVMKKELKCFIEAFYLNSTEAQEVPEVYSRWAISNFEQFILTGFKAIINSGTVVATIATAVISQSDVVVPVLGSAVAAATTYKYVTYFLQKNLNEMRKDAEIVFKHTLKKGLPRGNVRRN